MKKPHSLLLPAILFCVTLSLAVVGVFAAWIYFAANVTPLDQNVSIDMGNFYYDIAITEITPVSGTTVSSQTGSRVFPPLRSGGSAVLPPDFPHHKAAVPLW